MKPIKSPLLIAFLFIVATGFSQIVTIPDANFKNKLLSADVSNTIAKNLLGNFFKIDGNNDGEIQESEALQVSYLDVSASTIASLIGINSFTGLNTLICSNNQITSLNLTNLGYLTNLSCAQNQLTTIDVSSLGNLINLNCSYNQLTSIAVSNLVNLTSLNCDANQVTSLVVNNLVNLINLSCVQNQLTSLNVGNLVNLTNLSCAQNQLTSLNVNNLVNLTQLLCFENQLTSLDVSNLVNLNFLYCSNNSIASLNVTNLFNLSNLLCDGNLLASLGISNLMNLTYLNCAQNQLTSLNVSNLVNMINLQCYNNTLTSLDVSDLVNLTELNCSNNLLTSLNVNDLVNLNTLNCAGNQLQVLDLSSLTSLIGFNASNNLFYELDFSNNPVFGRNSLSTNYWVYISSNPNLTFINFKNGNTFQSSLSTISFSNLPSLQFVCLDDFEENTGLELFFNNPTVVFNSYCSFTPSGNFNTIKGAITFDANANGCEASDMLQPNIRINMNDGTIQGATFTNSAGNYNFYTQTGSFTLTPNAENSLWFNFSPATFTIPFANNNNNTVTQNICIATNGVHPDLEIVVSPIVPARPGFDAIYNIVYKNKGNQTLSGVVNFNYDDMVLDYVSSSIVPTTQTTGNLTFNYNNLLPFETRSILLTLNVNGSIESPPVTINDVLVLNTSITPLINDEISADNAFTLNQTVVSSFDPNDIICIEGAVVNPSLIGEYLHYLVRYENTGTAAAENIVVKTEIDPAKFDIATMQTLHTSYNAYTRIVNNKVEFIFENIQLAGSPTGGHGHVLFKIKSKNTLQLNDNVSINADIFFDYNFPIDTDFATTTFQLLNNSSFIKDDSISIFPNPANSVVNIKCDSTIKSIELFDVQGRVLVTKIIYENSEVLDISDKANGIYFLKITSDKGSKVEKLIKE